MVQDKEEKKGEGKMTVEEAGHKGGEAVVDKYGPEHMAEIGRKGGEHSHGGHNVERETDNEDNDNREGRGKSDKDSKRGLASADKETREKVAKKGGESSHRK
jgi:uncharacterized protein